MSPSLNVDSRVLVGVIALAIGIAMIAFLGTGMYVLQMTVAQPVDAEVQSTNVTEVSCTIDQGCQYQYAPVVEYNYTYDGKTYTSSRVFPEGTSSLMTFREQARQIADQYDRGDRITAYVVPGFPRHAHLKKKLPGLAFTGFGLFGVVLAVFGVAGIKQGLFDEKPDTGF